MAPRRVTGVGASRRVALQLCLYPLLAMALVAGWQAATVHVNYRGDWTALFCIGSRFPVPAELADEHVYVFPDSAGFDGQFYHLMAHDPVFQRGFDRYIDTPEYRYRRILVPALAFLFAGGRSGFIDAAYLLVCWAFIGWGTFWACEFARVHQRPIWLGLLFLCLPAVLVSIDRLVVDVALSAFTIGFALHASRQPSWKLYAILVAAALTRETGVLLVVGHCLSLSFRGRWRSAMIFASAALPALSWYAFVHAKTQAFHPAGMLTAVPFGRLLTAVLHLSFAPGTPLRLMWLFGGAEALALTGTLGAMVVAVAWVAHRKYEPTAFVAGLFVLLCVTLGLSGPYDLFAHIFNYGRVFTPLFLLLALEAVRSGRVVSALPLACMVPQTGLQLGSQVLAVMHQMLG